MVKKTLYEYPFLKRNIIQWQHRMAKAGLSQKMIAKKSGISETTISQIISFKRDNPRLSTIKKIEEALDSYGV